MWRVSVGKLYFIVLLQFSFSCQCPYHHALCRRKGETGNKAEGKEKRHLYPDQNENEFALKGREEEIQRLFNATFKMPTNGKPGKQVKTGIRQGKAVPPHVVYYIKSTLRPIDERPTKTTHVVTETTTTTSRPIESTYISTDQTDVETNSDIAIPIQCEKFKMTKTFDLGEMADLWRIAYHTMPHKLKCFNLHIKLLTPEDQQRYAKTYGDFNNSVRWAECNLEIISNDDSSDNVKRRHFLQGCDSHYGVMENIIINEDHFENVTAVSLHHETPDQWLIYKDLLMMRDCGTGDLAIFNRIPSELTMSDIQDALQAFGEPGREHDTGINKENPPEPETAAKCEKFKDTKFFDLNEMINIWKIVYSTMPDRLKGFELYIEAMNADDQQHYAKIYGDFNGMVQWDQCTFEIKLMANNNIGRQRKHFLQGNQDDKGVLHNIIIDVEHITNTTLVSLHQESPDQWLVYKNFLLMRSCNSGDLAVFRRTPSGLRVKDFQEALSVFGETEPVNGTAADEC